MKEKLKWNTSRNKQMNQIGGQGRTLTQETFKWNSWTNIFRPKTKNVNNY